jgi:hypothetical protein
VWRRVDEVAERDQRGGKTNSGPVERGDEDLGMRVEGVGDVEVVCDEGFEPGLALVDGAGVFGAAEGDICAAGVRVSGLRVLLGFTWWVFVVAGAVTYAEKNRPLPVNTVMKTSS